MSTLISIVVFAAILGIMVFFHELGHYLVAIACGVRVNVFSIGFGKKLLQYKYKDTIYCISAIPLGGYVQMAGENPFEETSGDPGEFYSHPRWQRILIALAGPAANVVLAIVILTGLYMVRFEYIPVLDSPAIIGHLNKEGPAAKAGLLEGDRIVSIQNVQNPIWKSVYDVLLEAKLTPDKPIKVQVQRGDATLSFDIKGEDRPDEAIYIGVFPQEQTIITSIEPERPAYQAGLRLGDEITSLNDTPVRTITEVIAYLQNNKDKEIAVHVARNNNAQTYMVKPYFDQQQNRYRMGFGNSYRIDYKKLGLTDAFKESVSTNQRFLGFVLYTLQKMVSGAASIKQLSGPIGMARETSKVMQQKDWVYDILGMMALISINLGVLNLLPFPILDGGLITITLFEGLLRRDMNQQVKERIYQAAFVLILIFTVVVMYNDISKIPFFSKFLP